MGDDLAFPGTHATTMSSLAQIWKPYSKLLGEQEVSKKGDKSGDTPGTPAHPPRDKSGDMPSGL